MIPRGSIYLRLRSDVLATFPSGFVSSKRNTPTFADWLLKASGNYHVQSISNSEILIHANPSDLALSLLVEVEFLSNHCFEQLQEIARYYVDDQERSDAWNVVTIYYFGFFAAQIFSRLVGNPVVYIGREQINTIKALASFTTGNSGVGSYFLEKVRDISVTQAEYRIKKTGNSKIHEATWIQVFNYLKKLLNDPTLQRDPEEVLFYESITTEALTTVYNLAWPSLVRTKSNYGAGFAYVGVQNNSIAKTKKLLKFWEGADAKVMGILDSSISACLPSERTNYFNHVKFLHDVSQAIFILNRNLYSELLDRSGINRIWEKHRSQFRTRMSINRDEYPLIGNTF